MLLKRRINVVGHFSYRASRLSIVTVVTSICPAQLFNLTAQERFPDAGRTQLDVRRFRHIRLYQSCNYHFDLMGNWM